MACSDANHLKLWEILNHACGLQTIETRIRFIMQRFNEEDMGSFPLLDRIGKIL